MTRKDNGLLADAGPESPPVAAVRYALELAIAAHEGQTDKAGARYIAHCLYVAQRAFETALREGWAAGYALRCFNVGLLHDTLEDCEWATPQMIRDQIGPDVEAVVRLTKREGQSEDEYLSLIEANQMASIVKRCDLAHNMDLTRLQSPTQKDFDRREKYCRQWYRLIGAARTATPEDTQPKTNPNPQSNGETV